MAKRKNGEGTWGEKTIKGIKYRFFRNTEGKYFYGKTDKEIKEKIKKYEKSSSTPKEDKEIQKQTFGEYVLDWLLTKKKTGVKRNTTDGYEACINGQLLKYKHFNLADLQVGTIDTDTIQEYYTSLADHYSKSTIDKNYAILSQCIKYGNKRNHFKEIIDMDEIEKPHEDIIKKQERELHFLNDEDMKKLYDESKRVNVPGFNFGGKIGSYTYGNNANVIIFILHTGLRISEAIELKWENVDLVNKKIYVKKNAANIKDRETGEKVNTSSSTKSKKSTRIIPLNDIAIEILQYELTLYEEYKSEYVFVTDNGDKIKSRQNINRTLRAMVIRSRCSVPDLTPHELRHSFGSALLRKGVDIKIVSNLLGHSQISITYNIYIHILEEQEIDAVNALNEINKIV